MKMQKTEKLELFSLMTNYSKEAQGAKIPLHPQRAPIPRVEVGSPAMTVDQATEADFQYFLAHPDEEQYVREFVPGEFGKAELPELPPGYRFATLVTVRLRVDGEPVGRFREAMAICEELGEL
jgi:hypothetical protein